MSLEKRAMMRPLGVVSKKVIPLRRTPARSTRWRTRVARSEPTTSTSTLRYKLITEPDGRIEEEPNVNETKAKLGNGFGVRWAK